MGAAVAALLLKEWKAVAVGVAAFLVAFAWGYRVGNTAGYHNGWKEGRSALQAETLKALREKNDAADRADDHLDACLGDPACRVRDDGWRIDR